MANPFERCPSTWKGLENRIQVRCDRWGGHGGEHRGFDDQDMAYSWPNFDGHEELPESHVHVPWNQPVPNNLEVDETVTDEDHRADDEQVLRIELQQWKDRCLEAERARDQYYRSWQNAVQQRDDVRRDAELSQQQLHDVLDKLETIRRLTNGVPTRADA